MSYVRRRRWVRTRVQLAGDAGAGSALLDALCRFSGFQEDPRVVWLGASFYGFLGASVKEQRENQQRQHISCSKLHRFLDISCHQVSLEEHDDDDEHGERRVREEEQEDGNKIAFTTTIITSSTLSRHSSVTPAVLHCVYRYGLPQCLRPALWLEWSGGSHLLCESPRKFDELLERSDRVSGQSLQDILQDVVRTAPQHPFFAKRGGGADELRGVLLSLEFNQTLPSYHQAFSYIVATVLLNLPARETFWVVTSLFISFSPSGYYERYTLQHDLQVYSEIIARRFPDIHAHFVTRSIDVSVFASGWLQGLFCAHFLFCTAARILDVLFAEGNSSSLVRFLVAFTGKFRSQLLMMDSSGSLGYFANTWARNCFSVESLVHAMENDRRTSIILTRREEIASRAIAV